MEVFERRRRGRGLRCAGALHHATSSRWASEVIYSEADRMQHGATNAEHGGMGARVGQRGLTQRNALAHLLADVAAVRLDPPRGGMVERDAVEVEPAPVSMDEQCGRVGRSSSAAG